LLLRSDHPPLCSVAVRCIRRYRRSMAVYALGDQIPTIDASAYVHPDAVVIGSVTIGEESSVWPSAVLRGDGGPIVIGARTSIQDGSVLHVTAEHPTFVGDDCVIGHLVHLEGCTIESRVLIGSGAVVLHRAVIGSGAVVAAGAIVLNDTIVPPGALVAGVPAKVRDAAADPKLIDHGVEVYLAKGRRYASELRRID
jgi:carbonic anhydrase/acetyltransferase-like protein (isoleucine patch superfamily)